MGRRLNDTALAQQNRNVFHSQWPGEVKSLYVEAAPAHQEVKLFDSFHSFRNDRDAQFMRETDDRLHNRCVSLEPLANPR